MPRALLLALALAAAPAAAFAQQPLQPSPLDSTTPRAVRARELVQLVLARDSAKAVAYLVANGGSRYAAASQIEQDLGAVLTALKEGSFAIARYDALGQQFVGLPIAPKGSGDQPRRAILLDVDLAAPHKINRVGVVNIGGGNGG